MNELEQLRDKLQDEYRFTRRAISVGCTAHIDYKGSTFEKYTEYVISVQPGFDGHLNQNFGGNSLQECLNKFNTAAEGAK